MIREAATTTDVRKRKIMTILRKINYNNCPTIKQFGLHVNLEFTEVDARVLDPPEIGYAAGRVVRPMQGTWRAENLKYIDPRPVHKWGFLNLDDRILRSNIENVAGMVSSRSF